MPDQTPSVGMARKLAAIFSMDVAGYSRLMGDDEEATIRTLTAHREVISSLIQQYRGRVVDSPGDNLLAEFASVVDAVRCAVEIQHELKDKNAELPDHRQMRFRIGINLGDVIVEGERLYGDGVNIAARLESLAIPGCICVSGTVYDQVETKLPLSYEYAGEQMVKNIAKPVRVYRVAVEVPSPLGGEGQGEGAAKATEGSKFRVPGSKFRRLRPAHWIMAGLLLIAGVMAAVRYGPLSSFRVPQSEIRTPEAQPPALPLPDKPSLMVMPFVNMSNDPTQDYFSNGMTDVLTSALSRISSLFVIARNTAFTYQGKAVNVQEVGKELGVRYVLEGSVQKAGEHVRIVVQLIDAVTGYHVWSEQYDRPVKDIFALQDEIIQKIVTTLKLQLTLEEQGWGTRRHTDNLEAYDAFLRGKDYCCRFTKEATAQARQLFEKAVALDPQYAEAYAWLAETYFLEWIFGWSADPQTLERAFALAQQAVALDDALPVAHSHLSQVYAQKQQYDQAIAEAERAIALDPNDAESYHPLAQALDVAGRPADGLRAIEQAMRLNPHYPPPYLFQLGVAYLLSGRYTEAVAALKDVISRSPNLFFAHINLALSYVGQWLSQQSSAAQPLEEARTEVQQALAFNDSLHWSHITLGSVFLYQQQYEQALAEEERAVALAPPDGWSYAALAEVLSAMGRTEEALAAAAQALRLKCQVVADYHLADVGAAYAVAGRYEEARAPLQRYLSRYPNILPAHLMLAAVYSELGQTAEAQKEAAEVLRLNPKFSLEVHKQRMPIKDPAVLERHIAALKKAGLK